MSRHRENIYLRKDGGYERRYIIGKKENGKTVFGYVYGKKYTKVKRKLTLLKGEEVKNRTDSIVIHRDGTVFTWIQTWLECYIKNGIKQSTYSIYRGQMERHILPIIGDKKLRTIDKTVMQSLYHTMLNQAVSERTAQSVCRRFRAALCTAQEEGYLKLVPALPFRKMTTSKRKEARCLTELEQKKLETVLNPSSEKDLAILFSLYTGAQIGECCALQWGDINFKEHEVQISRTMQRIRIYGKEKKTTLVQTETKTQNAVRSIPLTRSLERLLLSLNDQKHACKGDFVFGNGTKSIEPRTLQNYIQDLTKQVKLKEVHFHTLRHTFATRCREKQIDAKTLSELLEHSSVKIALNWYCHPTKKQK